MKKAIPTLRQLVLVILTSLGLGAAQAADKPETAGKAVVHHIKPNAVEKLKAEKKVVILDIRTPEEFQAGHISGATNINFRSPDFEKQLAALPKDKSYLVHCASGNRSTQALPVFRRLHFTDVYHLDGGMKAWEKASLPVVK